MQSPTDPADRTHTIGVEAFDATYGAGFQASDDSPHAVECELVEDGGAFVAHRPTNADRPRRVAVVDGTLRTEARLTRTGRDGDVSVGSAGNWATGAVLVDGDEPARFDQVTTGRAAICTGGRPVHLPDHRDGWRWEPYAVDGTDVEAARASRGSARPAGCSGLMEASAWRRTASSTRGTPRPSRMSTSSSSDTPPRGRRDRRPRGSQGHGPPDSGQPGPS